jgi:hypothetical protein
VRRQGIRRSAALFFMLIAAGLFNPAAAVHAAETFLVAAKGVSSPIIVGAGEDRAVRRAVEDLAKDIQRVSNTLPAIQSVPPSTSEESIIVGTIGVNTLIDQLIADGKLDVHEIAGKWESYIVRRVESPFPNVPHALVIAGSDRRGTIFGIYSVSELIGVSPWYWWADVPVKKQDPLILSAPEIVQGPPAVKYRGIFINDEDWGLRPWAAQTFDPSTGNIGPKTYAKVFELLLRLKANLLWPAMHPGTNAFNYYPEDREIADEYGVVMGSSHAEQMLRDNVDEWHRDGVGDYNYVTNRDSVLNYWASRVKENGRFENIYTMGMRGIHDSGMPGGTDLADKARILTSIIADQRDMLRRDVSLDVAKIPQMFCPYKEVLDIYRCMPPLPDDITLTWPDDNYGYIEHFGTAAEQARSGGSGVYYHVSYWGRPYDYLWLCSTSPGQIWEEMTKAWDYGARTIWVVNVGDIKPAELSMEYFLKLAWAPHQFGPEQNAQLLREHIARDLGPEHAADIVSLLQEYYRLCFQRKPEHMGYDGAMSLLAVPFFSSQAAVQRLQEFDALALRAATLGHSLPASDQDAYYELVLYPIVGARLANKKGLSYFRYLDAAARGEKDAANYLLEAQTALAEIHRETSVYNDTIANGKWRGILSDHPRDRPTYSLPAKLPTNHVASELAIVPANKDFFIPAARTTSRKAGLDCHWSTIEGLGYHGESVAVFPTTTASRATPERILAESPALIYDIAIPTTGKWTIEVQTLPTWSVAGDGGQHYALAIDNGPVVMVSLPKYKGEMDGAWQRDVLRNASLTATEHDLVVGRHTVALYMVEPGVVVDTLRFEFKN